MNSRLPLIDKIQLELGAQEPWPKDVKLYQPYEVEQILLPDNANCLAVQAFLKMCNLNYEIVSKANAEYMSPSGKVPFIRCGAFVIAELEGIVQFIKKKGISLSANLEPEQKTDIRAYMCLVHTVLENAELYICWCDTETYNEVTKPRNGSVYPWPLNHIQTWNKRSAVVKRLKIMGWYNKTLESVFQEVENCCQALTDRLEGKEYFFGKKVTELDALVYGHIHAIVSVTLPAGNLKLAHIVNRFDKLVSHSKRIHKYVMKAEIQSESNPHVYPANLKASSCLDSPKNRNQEVASVIEPEVKTRFECISSFDSDNSLSNSLSDVDTEDLLLGGSDHGTSLY